MREYGIVGEHLSHTFSPKIYNMLFKRHNLKAVYKVLEISENTFDFIVGDVTKNLSGFNVTIPYKSRIMGYLDSVSQDAMEIGAVNVVDAEKRGFNTDWKGFMRSLKDVELDGKYALVLGAGGAARAVCYALKNMGLEIYIVNRTKEKAVSLAQKFDAKVGMPDFSKVSIVVNATPLGMYPNVGSRPEIELSKFSRKCVVYDLVYNPRPTKFLKEARLLGLRTIDGFEMLVQQAILNLRIWSLDELVDDLVAKKDFKQLTKWFQKCRIE